MAWKFFFRAIGGRAVKERRIRLIRNGDAWLSFCESVIVDIATASASSSAGVDACFMERDRLIMLESVPVH